MELQVIGVCRFSMLVTGGFAKGPKDLDERARFLFDEARLALRMAWFEHVLVPSLRHQTDDRFTFVVLASSRMPGAWQDRLRDLVATCPGMVAEFPEPGSHHHVANAAIRTRVDPEAVVLASFRLDDDDDGLAKDYIARVRRDFEEVLLALFVSYGHVSCDYSRGLILEADGISASLLQNYVHAWTCAQTIYQKPDARLGLFDMAHHRHMRHMPTVSLQDSNMFVRGRHSVNDSPLRLHDADTKLVDIEVLSSRFGITLANLQSAILQAEAMPG